MADRFGLPRPQLPSVHAPALHAAVKEALGIIASVGFVDHGHIRSGTERDEHHFRTRRTYAEVAGSPGYDIIEAAGLQPWPPLTAAQEAILDSRKREGEAEIRESARFAAEGDRAVRRRRGALAG